MPTGTSERVKASITVLFCFSRMFFCRQFQSDLRALSMLSKLERSFSFDALVLGVTGSDVGFSQAAVSSSELASSVFSSNPVLLAER